MSKHFITVYSFIILVFLLPKSNPPQLRGDKPLVFMDSLPNMCLIITPEDMKSINPFTNILTNTFPEPNNHQTYSGCHYQFYAPEANEPGQIAIRFIKWGTKKEAGDDFRNFFLSEWSAWGLAPERLYNIADSAYFGYNADDTTKCDECGLVATIGQYGIYISFKGQYEKIPRKQKKEAALKILQLIYDRIPALLPSRIRNRQ